MDQNAKQTKTATPVPLYTKIGWVLAWIVMAVILVMVLRNCATSIFYGSQTGQQTVDTYYRLGLEDGSSGHGPHLRGEAVDNPVLRKAYSKGYREGSDRNRQQGGGAPGGGN